MAGQVEQSDGVVAGEAARVPEERLCVLAEVVEVLVHFYPPTHHQLQVLGVGLVGRGRLALVARQVEQGLRVEAIEAPFPIEEGLFLTTENQVVVGRQLAASHSV